MIRRSPRRRSLARRFTSARRSVLNATNCLRASAACRPTNCCPPSSKFEQSFDPLQPAFEFLDTSAVFCCQHSRRGFYLRHVVPRSVRHSARGDRARHAGHVHASGEGFHIPDEYLKVSTHIGLRAVRPCRAQGFVHQQEVAAEFQGHAPESF